MGLKENLPEELAHKLKNIKNAASIIWEKPKHIHFTNHNIEHSENIIAILSYILKRNNPLTDHELFILLASAYLHDIGMQSAIHAGIEKKDQYTLNDLMIIRNKHHETSAKMIVESINPNVTNKINCGLNNCANYGKFISIISKSHRKGKPPINDSSLDNDFLKTGIEIRNRILASLLRLSDELDCDYTRVNMDELKVWTIPTKQKIYWWIHHYTKAISIKNGIIKIYYRIPICYKNTDIDKIIFQETMNSIQKQLDEVLPILWDIEIYLRFDSDSKNNTNNYTDDPNIILMPDDLVKFLNDKYIIKNNAAELSEKTSMNYYIENISESDNKELKTLMIEILVYAKNEEHQKVIEKINQALKLNIHPNEKIPLLFTLGNSLHILGEYDEALKQFNNILSINKFNISEKNEKSIISFYTLNNIGIVYSSNGEYDLALDYFNKASLISKEINYKLGEARILSNLAIINQKKGNIKLAIQNLQIASEIYKKIGMKEDEAKDLVNMGVLNKYLGRFDESLKNYFDSLKIFNVVGNKLDKASILGNIGIIYKERKENENALKYFKSSLNIFKEINNLQGEADTLVNIGNVLRELKKIDESLNCYNSALSIYEKLKNKHGIAYVLGNKGNLYIDNNNLDLALKCHCDALEIDKFLGCKIDEAMDLGNIGVVHKRKENYKLARQYFNESLSIFSEQNVNTSARINFQNQLNSILEL